MATEKKRLHRDTRQGKIGGVCAGLAAYYGWEVWVVRIVAVSGLILASKITLVVYCVAWAALDKAPAKSSSSSSQLLKETTTVERTADGRSIEVKTKVWQAGEVPKDALKDIAKQFTQIEQSVRSMERYVTSSEYKVRQEINRL